MELEGAGHLDESQLEAYSMRRVPEDEAACVEEHLLVCESCRQQLADTDAFVHAMRGAAGRLRAAPHMTGRGWVQWGLRPVLATLVVVVGIGIAVRMDHKAPIGAEVVVLQATRGGGLVAQVTAGRPLLLKPNLDGLPALPEYHLRILDRTGKRTWQGNFLSSAGGASIPQQPPGIYFVELYSIPGTLLREYAMEVKAQR